MHVVFQGRDVFRHIYIGRLLAFCRYGHVVTRQRCHSPLAFGLIWGDNCPSISSAVSSRPAAILAAIQAKLADMPGKQNGGGVGWWWWVYSYSSETKQS